MTQAKQLISFYSIYISFSPSNIVLHDRKCSSGLVLFLNLSLFQVIFIVTLIRFHSIGCFLPWFRFSFGRTFFFFVYDHIIAKDQRTTGSNSSYFKVKIKY